MWVPPDQLQSRLATWARVVVLRVLLVLAAGVAVGAAALLLR